MPGGRVGLVDFIVLVFYVHGEVVRGPEEADSWIVESAGQGSVG